MGLVLLLRLVQSVRRTARTKHGEIDTIARPRCLRLPVLRKRQKTGTFGRVICCVLAFLVVCTASEAAEPAPPSDEPAIVAGVAIGFPPYQFQDSQGQPTGIDVDVATLVFTRLKRNFLFRQDRWNNLLGAMRFNTDLTLLVGAEIDAGRRQFFDFTTPYYARHITIFVPKNSPLQRTEDLYGKLVTGDKHSFVERNLREDRAHIRIMPTASKEESFHKLQHGEVDAVIAPAEVGHFLARELRLEVRTIGMTDPGSPVAFAVRKGNRALVDAINTELQKLRQEGEIERIIRRYQ